MHCRFFLEVATGLEGLGFQVGIVEDLGFTWHRPPHPEPPGWLRFLGVGLAP